MPVGAEVPPIGPVLNVLPTGAALGAGAVNGDEGFSTGVGAVTGRLLGLAVGGAGLAGDGFSTATVCFGGCCTGFG